MRVVCAVCLPGEGGDDVMMMMCGPGEREVVEVVMVCGWWGDTLRCDVV